MADIKDVVRLGIDSYRGNVANFTAGETQDTLRQALLEANNGSTKIDYRAVRDGRCAGLFTIVEDILKVVIPEGFVGDEYFNSLVDFKNISAGEENVFVVEDSTLFVVDEAAAGTQGLRRQRLSGRQTITIPTTWKMVRIYEDLERILSGQADFNQLIEKVAKSFRRKLLEDVYTLWAGATKEDLGAQFFPTAGNYDEDALLDVIAHVEAASGAEHVTIIGTQKTLRKLKFDGAQAKDDLYNLGYVGKFYGSNVVKVPQRHKVGTKEFLFPDNELTIIAGDSKPIKCVYQGDSLIIPRDPSQNSDLTQEYVYGDRYGMGLVLIGGNAGIGRYQITN